MSRSLLLSVALTAGLMLPAVAQPSWTSLVDSSDGATRMLVDTKSFVSERSTTGVDFIAAIFTLVENGSQTGEFAFVTNKST